VIAAGIPVTGTTAITGAAASSAITGTTATAIDEKKDIEHP
jgi:hypothetical protein